MGDTRVTAREFQQLLDRAARMAREHFHAISQLRLAFESRYGVGYSDIDADQIIEVVDLHGGKLTLAECDQIMTDLGYPPKERT